MVSHAKGKTEITPVKINIKEFETLEVDCTSLDSNSKIRQILKKNKEENKALRLLLKGSRSLDFTADIELLEKEFEGEYFFLKIIDDIHLPEDLTEDETIRGNFISLIKVEIKKEKDNKKKKELENALRVGIAYLDGRM